MKTATIPFPREFGPGAVGIDCRAVKRALSVALGGARGMNIKNNTFAKPAQSALVEFKASHDLLNDPVYTLPAHEALRPFFDEAGAALMARKALQLVATNQREAYVSAWRWAIAHRQENVYAEVRPIPETLAPFETSTVIRTDCSGESEILARWKNLPDPSGLGFNGQGNTGTILAHGTQIPLSAAQIGDFIVYRSGPTDKYGHHVVTILSLLPHGDFEVGSNGKQGDPGSYSHSAMLASQAASGYPLATCVRWLPSAV
jgi:hypothetical protein